MAWVAGRKVKLLPAGRSTDRASRAQVVVREREVSEEAVLEASKTVNRVLSTRVCPGWSMLN